MKIAIYYIPEKGEFYNLGSSLVGHDIRENKSLNVPNHFKNEWNKNAREYGFHLTLVDAVYIEGLEIDTIAEKLDNLIDCFSKKNEYALTALSKPVSFWRDGGDQAALRFEPNMATAVLHTSLVCTLQREGKGSLYLDQFNKGILKNLTTDKINKIKMFKSPYVLDEFKPHFTLINPYRGNDHSKIENDLNKLFSNFKEIKIDRLCLVIQKNDNDFFTIYKEFKLT